MSQVSILRADAQALTNVTNNNPTNYTYRLQRPMREVTSIALLRSCIPRSSVVTLVRISDFFASNVGTGSTGTFHQLVVTMAAAIGQQPDKSSYVATITNPAATVDLRVHDAYTRVEYNADGSFYKTYDVLICTGSVLTTTFTDWTISAEGGDINTAITPVNSSPVGNTAVLTVSIAPQPAVLRVKLNGNIGFGRIQEDFAMEDMWFSYKMYYPGMIVSHNGTKYVCQNKHLSILFAEDLTDRQWALYTDATNPSPQLSGLPPYTGTWRTDLSSTPQARTQLPPAASNDAFEVFYFGADAQSTESAVYLPEHVCQSTSMQTLQNISFEWVQTNGQPFIFPYTPNTRATNLETPTPTFTLERKYASPSLHLQVVHGAYWK